MSDDMCPNCNVEMYPGEVKIEDGKFYRNLDCGKCGERFYKVLYYMKKDEKR